MKYVQENVELNLIGGPQAASNMNAWTLDSRAIGLPVEIDHC